MLEVIQIPALSDNYIYLLHEAESGETAAVDPADAEPVLRALAERGWRLTQVLNTHHHGDHVGGNLELKRRTGCTITGSEQDRGRIPGIDRAVREGDIVHVGSAAAHVLFVPGHTLGHVAYWFRDESLLFCGDTLFAMGCGRLFEGTAEDMWGSLKRLRELPPETRGYCAHEYTETNGRFALTVEPDNPALLARMEEVRRLRRLGRPTVPFRIADELATNPFLRPESPAIRAALSLRQASEQDVFAETRRRKDHFRG